jgi:hypothetical protein
VFSYSNYTIYVHIEMESPPLTAEAIAFTEKKMDMTLGMLFDQLSFCLVMLIDIPVLI